VKNARIVLDTNVVVSGALFPGSVPAKALLLAQSSLVLISQETAEELTSTLMRPRFDRYLSPAIREQLVQAFLHACTVIEIPSPIRACRDPRDDKFLEVAVHGEAEFLVTGDADLLALHPFCGVAILPPAAFLERKD